MNRVRLATVLFAALLPTLALAQTRPTDEEDDIIYRPPTAATANARMGGGSRSDVKLPTIAALVPDHLGLAGSSKPVLYWYCSEATTLPREFSLVDSVSLDTVKRVQMTDPIEAGWQKIDLAALGVELTPGATYEWRIALIASETKRSDNAVAGGMIQHAGGGVDSSTLNDPGKSAQAGLWYDALDALMKQVMTDPPNPAAKKKLASLLAQVKLDDAAKFAAQ